MSLANSTSDGTLIMSESDVFMKESGNNEKIVLDKNWDSSSLFSYFPNPSSHLEKISKEAYLIHEITHKIPGSSFQVSCGLSTARDFAPAVRLESTCNITGSELFITLLDIGWREFITHVKACLKDYFENITNENSCEKNITFSTGIEDFKIKCYQDSNQKILILQDFRDCMLDFTEEILNCILDIEDLIECQLAVLKSLDFLTFYTCVLKNTQELFQMYKNTSSYMDIIKIILYPLNTTNAYCMYECLHYNFEKILNDINTL